jgi:hypothetical protein
MPSITLPANGKCPQCGGKIKSYYDVGKEFAGPSAQLKTP